MIVNLLRRSKKKRLKLVKLERPLQTHKTNAIIADMEELNHGEPTLEEIRMEWNALGFHKI